MGATGLAAAVMLPRDHGPGHRAQPTPTAGLGQLGLEPAERYERDRPSELVHVDLKKVSRVYGGAGHRMTTGRRNRRGVEQRRGRHQGTTGWDDARITMDDCTRLAYAEVAPDEKASSAMGLARRATSCYRCYRTLSHACWHHASVQLHPGCSRGDWINNLLRSYS